MAFNRLMLTTVGKTLYAKAQQGKLLQFTRVGIGDGDIGSGSLVNRTALLSEKLSLLIDTIQIVNETDSALIVTLKNDDLTEGFYFREIGIFAQDPDTLEEKLYLYDNAGTDGELIPDNGSGVQVNERLKFLILLENVTEVSFVPSGNPIYLGQDDIDDDTYGTGSLWSSSKIKSELALKQAKIPAAGLLKGDGAGGISGATAGMDYQTPTNVLTAETALADADYIPDYDTSATANRKTLWSNIKSAMKNYFDTVYAALSHSHSGYIQGLTFTGISVTTASFVSDATYTSWPYRAAVALTGVAADMVPNVVFDPDTAVSGVLAPVAACYAGGVYLYANAVPSTSLTVPTITCTKEVA